MKYLPRIATACLLLAIFNLPLLTAHAQGTAFTYQGQLQNNGSPANGLYDFVFSLSNAPSGGSQIGSAITNTSVPVTNGLFTTTIDFGSVFTGNASWLAIRVRTNGAASFVGLNPPQQLTPTPNAIYAESANGLSGTLSASQLSSIGNIYGFDNFFIGSAGNTLNDGTYNTGNGISALAALTEGDGNTANGYYALTSTTSGSENTANGAYALTANTSGFDNTADGYDALFSNLTGVGNTAIGESALGSLTNGSENTALGDDALLLNKSGNYNVAIGIDSLVHNTNGSANTAVGTTALYFNTNGSGNIALGYDAGLNINIGSSNIDIGSPGVANDNNITRIGTPGIQTQAYIAGTINGDGSGLTGLNAAQLSGIIPGGVSVPAGNLTGAGTLPATVLPASVTLLSANQTFTGNNTFTSTVTVTNSGPVDSMIIYGTRTNGQTQPMVYFENQATMTNTSPALRVRTDGISPDGAFSASVQVGANAPNSIIAEFGNSQTFVAWITNDGSIYTASNVYAANVFAKGVQLTSDRNAKDNFTTLDSETVLAKVAALPVTKWNYKADKSDVQHIGPMAQDFYTAFQLNGGDDKHISVVDEGGVALAAIQGLNQKVEEQTAEIKNKDVELQTLRQQNDLLAQRLDDLETTVKLLAEKK